MTNYLLPDFDLTFYLRTLALSKVPSMPRPSAFTEIYRARFAVARSGKLLTEASPFADSPDTQAPLLHTSVRSFDSASTCLGSEHQPQLTSPSDDTEVSPLPPANANLWQVIEEYIECDDIYLGVTDELHDAQIKATYDGALEELRETKEEHAAELAEMRATWDIKTDSLTRDITVLERVWRDGQNKILDQQDTITDLQKACEDKDGMIGNLHHQLDVQEQEHNSVLQDCWKQEKTLQKQLYDVRENNKYIRGLVIEARQKCDEETERADSAFNYANEYRNRADRAEEAAYELALEDLDNRQLQASNLSQARRIREMIAEKDPLINDVIRNRSENERLKARVHDLENQVSSQRQVIEDAFGEILPQLRSLETQGLTNVASLAESTEDDGIKSLSSWMDEFVKTATNNLEAGQELLEENDRLVVRAEADRQEINNLRETVLEKKNNIIDLDDKLWDLDWELQMMNSDNLELRNENIMLRPLGNRVPSLEARIKRLRGELNIRWKEQSEGVWGHIIANLHDQLVDANAELYNAEKVADQHREVVEEHKKWEKQAWALTHDIDFKENIIVGMQRNMNFMVEQHNRLRMHAGMEPLSCGANHGLGKVHIRTMMERMAEVHGYEITDEQREFAEKADEIDNQGFDESQLGPVDGNQNAVERIMAGVLDRIDNILKIAVSPSDATFITDEQPEEIVLTTDRVDEEAADRREAAAASNIAAIIAEVRNESQGSADSWTAEEEALVEAYF